MVDPPTLQLPHLLKLFSALAAPDNPLGRLETTKTQALFQDCNWAEAVGGCLSNICRCCLWRVERCAEIACSGQVNLGLRSGSPLWMSNGVWRLKGGTAWPWDSPHVCPPEPQRTSLKNRCHLCLAGWLPPVLEINDSGSPWSSTCSSKMTN